MKSPSKQSQVTHVNISKNDQGYYCHLTVEKVTSTHHNVRTPYVTGYTHELPTVGKTFILVGRGNGVVHGDRYLRTTEVKSVEVLGEKQLLFHTRNSTYKLTQGAVVMENYQYKHDQLGRRSYVIAPPTAESLKESLCKYFTGEAETIICGLGVARVHPLDRYCKKTGREIAKTNLKSSDFSILHVETFKGFVNCIVSDGKYVMELRTKKEDLHPFVARVDTVSHARGMICEWDYRIW